MSRPRVLVVRSGNRPFWGSRGRESIEIIEKQSHVIEPIPVGEEALSRPADLVVFTSQIAVERLFAEENRASLFRRAASRARIAAVGPATAKALSGFGAPADFAAAGSVQSLLAQLPEEIPGWRVLLPRGEDAGTELPEELVRRGAEVACLEVYRKIPKPADSELGLEILDRPFAAFCVTSPSAARWLFDAVGREALARLKRTPSVALGAATRRELAKHGVRRIEEPQESTFAAARRLLERLAAERPPAKLAAERPPA